MRDPASRLHANVVRCFEGVASWRPEATEVRSFGPHRAMTGGPTGYWNRVFALDRVDPDELGAAVDWMTARGHDFGVTTTDALLDEVLGILGPRGFEELPNHQPGMVLDPLEAIPAPRDDLAVVLVEGPDDLAAFNRVWRASYAIPDAVPGNVAPPSALDDPEAVLLLGRVRGEPAAIGKALVHEGTAGVYVIGVPPPFRRRGLGAAITWEVLRVARERGCDLGGLQASEMGYGVYERMGFRAVTTYHDLVPGDLAARLRAMREARGATR